MLFEVILGSGFFEMSVLELVLCELVEFVDVDDFGVGLVVGCYWLVCEIGCGGMSCVFEVKCVDGEFE